MELTGPSVHQSGEGGNADTQHRLTSLENIGPFLSILNASHNDLMSSLIEVGGPGLAQPSTDESGSGGFPDGSRMGGMGRFGSLTASLRTSWREEGQKPEIFGLDSNPGGKETVDSGEDDKLWRHPLSP